MTDPELNGFIQAIMEANENEKGGASQNRWSLISLIEDWFHSDDA